MSQAAFSNFSTPRLPDFSLLVPVGEAAALLGMHPDSMSKLCRETLESEGNAIFATPPGGGQARWFIYRHYDMRLRKHADPRYIEPDLSSFTGKQREQAYQRRACVERLRKARMHSTAEMTAALSSIIDQARREYPALRISRSRLYEWDRRFNYPADLVRLIDERGGDRCGKGDPDSWGAFKDLFLHPNAPSARDCWKRVKRLAVDNGWEWTGYRSCTRSLNKHVPEQEQIRHRQPAMYRQQMQPFIAQGAESWRAGETWIGDHKQLDLVCRWGKTIARPWLTAWMDWRTRKLAGWVLSDNPNSTTILAALRHGLKEPANFGGPANVWIDNGKDYDAWLFHGQTKKQRLSKIRPAVDEPRTLGIFNALKIEAHFSMAYNPNGKARLERWFRTLESFCKSFDTYTGDGIDTKPERLNEIVASYRLIPTFETVYQRLTDHINGCNARTDHAIDDLSDNAQTISPAEALARWCDTKRIMADPASLDLLMMNWHKPVTVGRNGITINLRGRPIHYGQYDQALAPFKALAKAERPNVMVAFDPHDLREIRVYDDQFRWLCNAPMNVQGGLHGGDPISVEHVGELCRQKANYEKAAKHVALNSLTTMLTDEERLAEIAGSQHAAASEAPADPPVMKIVQTPLDGQAKEIEREQFRQAACGEVSPGGAAKAPRAIDLIRQNMKPKEREEESSIDWRAILRERNREW